MASIEQRRMRLDGIQALRGIAAILVTTFHAQLDVEQHYQSFTKDLFSFGEVGVPIFFVISGLIMVLTNSSGRYSIGDFYRRRLIRIFPIYWIMVAAYVAGMLLIGTFRPLSGGDFLGALMLAPAKARAIIGPAWTLSYELWFYFIFGIAMLLGTTRGLIALSALIVALVAIGVLTHPINETPALLTNAMQLEFLAGTWVGWLALRGRLPARLGPVLVGLAVILLIAGMAIGLRRLPLTLVWGVPCVLLVAGTVTWEMHEGTSKPVRGLARLGDASYVLYLLHMLAISLPAVLIKRHFRSLLAHPVTLNLCLTGLAIVLSVIVHRFVERPLLRVLSRVTSRTTPQPDAGPRAEGAAMSA